MTITISCSACGGDFRIPESLFATRFSGRETKIKCKKCGGLIVVDGTQKGLPRASARPTARPSRAPSAAARASRPPGRPSTSPQARASKLPLPARSSVPPLPERTSVPPLPARAAIPPSPGRASRPPARPSTLGGRRSALGGAQSAQPAQHAHRAGAALNPRRSSRPPQPVVAPRPAVAVPSVAPAQPAAPSPPVVESPPTPARDTAPEVQFTFTEPGTPAPNVTSISSASLRAVEVPQAADDSGANAKAAVDSVDVGVPARRGEAAPPLRAPVDAPARSGKRGWIVAGAGAALALGALGLLQARGSARFVSEASPVAAVNAVNAVNAVDALTAPASLTTGELHERALEAPAAPAAESPRTAPATLENVAPAPASAAASDVAAAPASAAVSDVAAAPASAAASAVGAAPGSAAVAYNEKALEGALRWGITNAEACHRAGRPSGSAQATLTFGPAGKVLRAELEGEPIASAPVSKCILSFLRSMMIPAFSGPEFTITRQITLR